MNSFRCTSLKHMTRAGILLLSAFVMICLSSCAHQRSLRGELGHGMSLEQKVLRGLGMVEANSEQRRTVLAVYDSINLQLRTLAEQSQQLKRKWQELDPKNPEFTTQSQELIRKRLAMQQQTWELETQFDRSVAETLDDAQWATWSAYVRERIPAGETSRASNNKERPNSRFRND